MFHVVAYGGDKKGKGNSKIPETLLAAAALLDTVETLKQALPDIQEEFRACDLMKRWVLFGNWNPFLKVRDRELGIAFHHQNTVIIQQELHSNPKPSSTYTLYDDIQHDDDFNHRILKKLKK